MRPSTLLSFLLFALLLLGACADAPPADAPPAESETAESDKVTDDDPSGETTNTPGQTFLEEGAPTVAILNAKTPLPGVLSGGQITPEQLDELAQAGYRTVVNLRTEGEEGDWDATAQAADLGLDYRRFPISGADGLTSENASVLDDLLADESLRPMVIHCGSGNRVGALFALRAFHVEGAEAEAALEAGRQAGLTRLEERVAPLLVRGE